MVRMLIAVAAFGLLLPGFAAAPAPPVAAPLDAETLRNLPPPVLAKILGGSALRNPERFVKSDIVQVNAGFVAVSLFAASIESPDPDICQTEHFMVGLESPRGRITGQATFIGYQWRPAGGCGQIDPTKDWAKGALDDFKRARPKPTT